MVIVVPIDLSCGFVVADVVESCKACSRDALDTVIRYQEMLLPTHKDARLLGKVVLGFVPSTRMHNIIEWLEKSLWLRIDKI